jgi:hypothetical protein
MLAMFEKAGRHNSNNKFYQFWQQDNHPILLKDVARLSKAPEYIHNNPVTCGMVNKAEGYPWSSAGDSIGQKGVVNVSIA